MASLKQALALFELQADFTLKQLNQSFRQKMRHQHTDKGGDLEFCKQLSAARDLLQEFKKDEMRATDEELYARTFDERRAAAKASLVSDEKAEVFRWMAWTCWKNCDDHDAPMALLPRADGKLHLIRQNSYVTPPVDNDDLWEGVVMLSEDVLEMKMEGIDDHCEVIVTEDADTGEILLSIIFEDEIATTLMLENRFAKDSRATRKRSRPTTLGDRPCRRARGMAAALWKCSRCMAILRMDKICDFCNESPPTVLDVETLSIEVED